MKIGIFDSGIGGLTVLNQAMITLPEEEFIYYADSDHVPYGTKSRDEVIGYVEGAVDFLVRQGVKAIVIACNTATSIAIDSVRDKYKLPILGMEPAVKPAIERCTNKRALVIATPLTVKENKLKNLLQQVDDNRRVDLLPLPKLVEFAELGVFETEEVENYLKKELSSYNMEDYSVLILGCTHFNYFKDTLRRILPAQVEFIDGSNGTINYLKRILIEKELLEHNQATVEYYISGRLITQESMLSRYNLLHQRLDQMLQY